MSTDETGAEPPGNAEAREEADAYLDQPAKEHLGETPATDNSTQRVGRRHEVEPGEAEEAEHET